jgi:hypothetical protein
MIITKNQLTEIKDGERLRFALVYQGGIANVFQVESFNLADFGRNATRVYQGDFHTAQYMAHGMGMAGAVVMTFACNMAGDIAKQKWSDDLESQPFSDDFAPVFYTIGF